MSAKKGCQSPNPRTKIPAVERFNEKWTPEPNTGCHLWTGAADTTGYGYIKSNGVQRRAHRVAWEMHSGRSVPAGLFVCHRCDQPACVNPAHLFLGTNQDNVDDMVRKGRQARGEKLPREMMSRFGEANACSRLTADEVAQIRELYRGGTMLQREIGALFGVAQTTVSGIVCMQARTRG